MTRCDWCAGWARFFGIQRHVTKQGDETAWVRYDECPACRVVYLNGTMQDKPVALAMSLVAADGREADFKRAWFEAPILPPLAVIQ